MKQILSCSAALLLCAAAFAAGPGIIGLPGTGHGSTNAPGVVTTPASASLTRVGLVANTNGDIMSPANALASQAEVNTGTNTTKLVTPATLAGSLSNGVTFGSGGTVVRLQPTNGNTLNVSSSLQASNLSAYRFTIPNNTNDALISYYNVDTNFLYGSGAGPATSVTNWNGLYVWTNIGTGFYYKSAARGVSNFVGYWGAIGSGQAINLSNSVGPTSLLGPYTSVNSAFPATNDMVFFRYGTNGGPLLRLNADAATNGTSLTVNSNGTLFRITSRPGSTLQSTNMVQAAP